MKIRTKLIIGFLFVSLLAALVGYWGLHQLEKVIQPLEDVMSSTENFHHLSEINDLTHYIQYLGEVLTQSARNYTFTHDKKWEQRYYAFRAEMDRAFRLSTYKSDDDNSKFFDRIESAKLALMYMESTAIEYVNRGQEAEAVYLLESETYWAQQRLFENGLQKYFAKQGMGEKPRILLKLAVQNTRAILQHSVNMTILFIFAIFILSAMISIFIAQKISRPLQELIKHIIETSRNRFAQRIHIVSNDEIGALAASFNEMTDNLQQTTVSKEYVERIVNTMIGSVMVVGPDALITMVNRGTLDLLGYTETELLHHPVSKVMGSHSSWFASGSIANWVGRGAVSEIEKSYRKKSGETVPVLFSGSIMRDSTGKVQGIVCAAVDITERQRAARALRRHHDRLEELVDVRTRKLAQATEDALAASRAKSTFLATMSHEIRTPLNAVIGLTKLALHNDMPSKIRDYLTKIEGASHLLLHVLNDILDFSKIEAGKLELEYTDFRLDALFVQLTNLFRGRAAEKGLEWHLDIADDCPCCLLGDVLRVEQILINLISNALKFTEAGQITIQVRVVGQPSDNPIQLEFSVADTGIGLTADQIRLLFNPFVQADSSTTRKYGGTGLGLSICNRLVQWMGGQIWVESVPGVGSTFRFTIAFTQKTHIETVPQLRLDYTALINQIGGAHVLLVEDTPINQQVARELLEWVGVLVDIANHGAEAVQMVENGHYHAVLMDVQMPIMDGYDATRAIRRHSRHSQLPIIAMTAYAMADDRKKCLAAGMNDHIGKPIDSERLYAILANHIKLDEPLPIDLAVLQNKHQLAMMTLLPGECPEIDGEAALQRVMGNKALLHKLLVEFKRDYSQVLEEVTQALAVGKASMARQRVHLIKGVAGNIGARRVQEAASALEVAIEEKRHDDWSALLANFANHLTRLLAMITNLPPQSVPVEVVADSQPLDRAELQTGLVQLANHLAGFKLDSVASFNNLKPELLRVGLHQEVQELETKIGIFDFDGARISLVTIARALEIALIV